MIGGDRRSKRDSETGAINSAVDCARYRGSRPQKTRSALQTRLRRGDPPYDLRQFEVSRHATNSAVRRFIQRGASELRNGEGPQTVLAMGMPARA